MGLDTRPNFLTARPQLPIDDLMGRGERRRHVSSALAIVVLCTGALAGCSRQPDLPTADVVARLEDFEIHLSAREVPAGEVVFGLMNDGPTVHELVVARTDRRADDLVLGKDGLSVAEEARGFRVVGEDESVRLSEQDVLDLVLKPGHYVLFCNLEGHYLGGMHTDLDVTA